MGAPTLLVVGDSLSAGYGLDRGQNWVDILAANSDRILGAHGQILNASISGETTTGGLSRLPGLLERHQPDIVLIALGANDGLRGLPLKMMQKPLRPCLQRRCGLDGRCAGSAHHCRRFHGAMAMSMPRT